MTRAKAARSAKRRLTSASIIEKRLEIVNSHVKCSPKECTSINIHDKSKYLLHETVIRNILREQEQKLGEDDPETLSTLNILAVLLFRMEMVEEARMICRRVIDACKAASGNVDRAKSYDVCLSTAQNNLGCALASESIGIAEALLRDANVSRKKLFHESNFQSHNIMHNLANIQFMKSDHHAASLLYRDALLHKDFVLERKSFDTCDTESSLADSLYRLGDYVGAEVIYRQLLHTLKSLVGVGHLYYVPIQKKLVSTLVQQQKYPEAEAVLHDILYALESRMDKNFINDPFARDILKIKSQIADLLCRQKKNLEGEAMYKEAIVSDEPGTIDGYVQCLIQQNKIEEAYQFYGLVLEKRNSTLGPVHPQTVHAVCVFADILLRSNKAENALQYYLRALNVYKRELGSGHFLTLSVIDNLGRTYEMMNVVNEAEKFYIEAVEGFGEVLGKYVYCKVDDFRRFIPSDVCLIYTTLPHVYN